MKPAKFGFIKIGQFFKGLKYCSLHNSLTEKLLHSGENANEQPDSGTRCASELMTF
jgi:hypothetical protein